MNLKQLAEEFGRGGDKGRASNVYYNDNTIYSYGEHFPIAIIVGPEHILFNFDKYSPSTSRQQSTILNVLEAQGWKIVRSNTQGVKNYHFIIK